MNPFETLIEAAFLLICGLSGIKYQKGKVKVDDGLLKLKINPKIGEMLIIVCSFGIFLGGIILLIASIWLFFKQYG